MVEKKPEDQDDEDIKKYMEQIQKEMEGAIKKDSPPKEPLIPEAKEDVLQKPIVEEDDVEPSIIPLDNEMQKEQENISEEGFKEKKNVLMEVEKKETDALIKSPSIEKAPLKDISGLDRVISNYMLFIIPSWGDLLGYPTLGTYVGQNVSKITSDIIIFLGSHELSIETEQGKAYCIFGLGYYFTKFELQQVSQGKYIVDNKFLTGIILSDFVYDHMSVSKNITLENDPDVVIAEKVIKVPVDLSNKTESQITFIKGALMRNLFIPNKDVILEMLDKIKSPETYKIDTQGHMLISAQKDNFNKILVSDKMKMYLQTGYMNPTAGIGEITYGADEFLKKYVSPIELEKINKYILELKHIYSTLEFDHTYLYSLLTNVATQLKAYGHIVMSPQASIDKPLTVKKSLLSSAKQETERISEWPEELERKEKIQEVKKQTYVTPLNVSHEPVIDSHGAVDYSSLKNYREPQKEEEQFVLRFEKSEEVQAKPLPMPPSGEDIEEVYLYLKYVIEEDFEMLSVAKAFGLARDILPGPYKIANPRYSWEMSRVENLYNKKPPQMGLPPKDKEDLLKMVNSWLALIEKEKEKERIRLEEERKRLEEEQREKERIARELEEKKRLEEERIRLENERIEREKLEKIRIQKEQVKKQRELERIEFEKQEQMRLEQEQIEKEKLKQAELQKEMQELKRIQAEKKTQAKLLKQKKKKEKKLEKQRQKIAKKKAKEQQKLEKITQEFESFEE